MRKSFIHDIALLAFLFAPSVICVVHNTHPASAGPFGCFMKEPPAAPKPAWQIKQDREGAAIQAKLYMDYREVEQ